jgi:hypothetical protein
MSVIHRLGQSCCLEMVDGLENALRGLGLALRIEPAQTPSPQAMRLSRGYRLLLASALPTVRITKQAMHGEGLPAVRKKRQQRLWRDPLHDVVQ